MENKKLTLKKLFEHEVDIGMSKLKNKGAGVFTAEEIAVLPEPVQRYFKYCRYIGREKMRGAKIVFGGVNFKLQIGKPWIKIKYKQHNFINEPLRLAYVHTRMFGLIPFEGRDKYGDGQGNMIGRLFGKKTLFDVKGSEINISAAVTFLSEALIVPSCALQEYIKWEPIDNNSCRGIFEYKGVRVGGIFMFNEKGEMTRFQTEDRYMYMDDGTSEKHKWSAVICDYAEMNGMMMPSRLKGVWNLEGGDHEYFDGRLENIEYF